MSCPLSSSRCGLFCIQLSAGCRDIESPALANRRGQVTLAQNRLKVLDRRARAGGEARALEGVEENQIDLAPQWREQLDEALGIVDGIIHAAQHHVFEGDALALLER